MTQGPWPQFSAAIRQELAIALNDFMADPDLGRKRLTAACLMVCTEAHLLHVTADEMNLGLKRLYEQLPGGRSGFAEQKVRHEAFDEFLEGCAKAFRDADKRGSSSA